MSAAAPLLAVRELYAGYGRVGVLEGVSLEVPEGGFVALVGSNGAGKSTLLRAISGLVPSSAGQILFAGEAISNAAPARIVGRGLLGTKPEIARSSVDLPAPLLPTRVTKPPSGTTSDTPSSTPTRP